LICRIAFFREFLRPQRWGLQKKMFALRRRNLLTNIQ
jgi:hypothetical protein